MGWDEHSAWHRDFEDLLHASISSASARGGLFVRLAKQVVYDNGNLAVASLWDVPERIGSTIADSIRLTDDGSLDKAQVKACLAQIIAKEIHTLVAPAVYDFSRQYSPQHLTSANSFFDSYPVLARRTIHVLSCLVESFTELFERLNDERKELGSEFEEPYRCLSRIVALPSEPHNGQRRSMLLVFSDCERLVYKPRSLAGEVYLTRVIESLSDAGIYLPEPHVLNRGTHGWMKWVDTPENPLSGDEVAVQIGTLLALANTIALVDLYAENVRLSANGIVVIDAEAVGLLSPDMNRRLPSLRPPNVLELGILPRATGISRSEWWDISLSGITSGRRTVPAGLDYVGPKEARWPTTVYHHISAEHTAVRSAISVLSLREVILHVTQGFDRALAVLARIGPVPIESDQRSHFRYIHRPTAPYLRTLLRMTDPSCGTSAEALISEVLSYAEELLEQAATHSSPMTMPIVAEEIAALIHGDVPRLTAKQLDDSFTLSSGESAWALPPRTTSTQLIEMSLRLRFEGLKRTSGVSGSPQSCESESSSVRECIREIADAVEKNLAVMEYPNGLCYVLGVAPHERSGIPEITEVGASLYDGVSGILFILGVAASVLDRNDEYVHLLRRLVNVIEQEFENALRPGSLISGPMGAVYVASFLYRISTAHSSLSQFWAEQLQQYVHYLDRGVLKAPADCADVVTGLAGWLLILDSLPDEVVSARIRELQEWLIKETLDLQQETGAWPSLGKAKMCGFSHGAAGIRYALGRVMVQGLGPEKEIRRAMRAAVEFEQDSFEPSISNWRDYRFEETDARAYSTFSAWCHGAAGIALAEIGLARLGLPIRSERIHAVFQLSEYSANTRLSLCCGSASYFEVDRLLQKGDRLLYSTKQTATGEVKRSEEQDTPLGLFKASYGTGLLRAMTSCISDLPSLLLFE